MRVILVPLSGEAHDRPALAAAYHVAQPFRAHIAGLFIRPDPVDASGVFQGMPPEMFDRVTPAARATWNERAGLAKQAFDEARAATDAALADRPTGTATMTAHWREVTGAEDVLLAEHGRLADLVVFAGVRADSAAEAKEQFASALLNSAGPILPVPDQALEGSPRNLVIAWNGTAEATRALSGSLPLLFNADRLHILTAATPRTPVESGAALAEYLGWHGLVCEAHPMYRKTRWGRRCSPGPRSSSPICWSWAAMVAAGCASAFSAASPGTCSTTTTCPS